METKDSSIIYVKQVIRGVDELNIDPRHWPEEREKIIEDLHNRAGDLNFRYAIEDLIIEAWNRPWTREARVIAKAAEMYDILFGEASRKRLQ